jgi:hypothetical protein
MASPGVTAADTFALAAGSPACQIRGGRRLTLTLPGELAFLDGGAVPDLDVAWIHGSEAAK